MASLADMEMGLLSVVANALSGSPVYAQGSIGPATDPRVSVFRAYRGWPTEKDLNLDMSGVAEGVKVTSKTVPMPRVVNVSIYPITGSEANATRYKTGRIISSTDVTSSVMSVALNTQANVVTYSGTPAVGQLASIVLRPDPLSDPVAYNYPIETEDAALSDVATKMAGQVPGAVASGNSVNLSSPATRATVSVGSTVVTEIARHRIHERIAIWAYTATVRDIVAGAIENAVAGTPFFEAANGDPCRLRKLNLFIDDRSSLKAAFRYDLIAEVEWPETSSATCMRAVSIGKNLAIPRGVFSNSRVS